MLKAKKSPICLHRTLVAYMLAYSKGICQGCKQQSPSMYGRLNNTTSYYYSDTGGICISFFHTRLQSELLLKINYPQGNFSLTCTCQEVGRICHDLKTVTFSDDIRAAILGYKRSASEDINVGAWIDQQLTPSSVLPVAYRLINDTRGYYSDPPPTAAM